MKAWTLRHLTWLNTVHFERAAQEATLLVTLANWSASRIASSGLSEPSMRRCNVLQHRCAQ